MSENTNPHLKLKLRFDDRFLSRTNVRGVEIYVVTFVVQHTLQKRTFMVWLDSELNLITSK